MTNFTAIKYKMAATLTFLYVYLMSRKTFMRCGLGLLAYNKYFTQ